MNLNIKTYGEINQQPFGYHKISIELRKELIKLVHEQKYTVYRAAQVLNINNSTAKAIIRKYRRDGSVFIRKSERTRLELQNRLQNMNQNLQKNKQKKLAKSSEELQQQQNEYDQQIMYLICTPLTDEYTFQNSYWLIPYL